MKMQIVSFLIHAIVALMFFAIGMFLWCLIGVPLERQFDHSCMGGIGATLSSPLGGMIGLWGYLQVFHKSS
jgi:hypothetical protein